MSQQQSRKRTASSGMAEGLSVEKIECVETEALRIANIGKNKEDRERVCFTNNYYDNGVEDEDFWALFVRRGTDFRVDVTLNQDYVADSEFWLEMEMAAVKKSNTGNGSLLVIYKKEEGDSSTNAYFTVGETSARKISLLVHLPATTIVSRYVLSLAAEIGVGSKIDEVYKTYSKDIFVIFNPYHKDDVTYFPEATKLEEYLQSDNGFVYTGKWRAKPWYFAQFQRQTVEFVFGLLERQKRVSRRDTAPEIARLMSGYINSCDQDYGVLTGNWSGDYEGGKKPWEWQGSAKIIKKYVESGEAVNYGQCWVFSALTNTVMRCLGVPTRSVTNYGSCHDTDMSLTLDTYFDEEGEKIEDMGDDSCWNFHVWNDVWMARPDLSRTGFGGWQAIDATPQEESGNSYRCGPSPLAAIMKGEVNVPHDTKFIYAEVNADRVDWTRVGGKKFVPTRVSNKNVGEAILTFSGNLDKWGKAIAQDVKNEYKYEEGSEKEQKAKDVALKKVKSKVLAAKLNNDVKMKVYCPDEKTKAIPAGTDTEAIITLTNTSNEDRFARLCLNAKIERYSGGKEIANIGAFKIPADPKAPKDLFPIKIAANSTHTQKFKIDKKHHLKYIDEEPNLSLHAFMRIKGTDKKEEQIKTKPLTCYYDKPDLEVELVDVPKIGVALNSEVKVNVHAPKIAGVEKFTNVKIELEGNAIKGDVEKEFSSIAPGQVISMTFKTPQWTWGKTGLNCTFSSTQMSFSGGCGVQFDVVY